MRCEDMRELISRTFEEKLEASANSAALEDHVTNCPDCKRYHDGLMADDLRLRAFAQSSQVPIDRIATNVKARIKKQPDKHQDAGTGFTAMPLFVRIAALVVVLLGLTLVLQTITKPDISFTSWDVVSAKVAQANSVKWEMEVTEGSLKLSIKAYISETGGFRIDTFHRGTIVNTTFYDDKNKQLVMLLENIKQYAIIPMDFPIAKMLNEQGDAKEMMEAFLKGDYVELGTKQIDGRWAAGIEADSEVLFGSASGAEKAELWVDVETKWPVRFTVIYSSSEGEPVVMQLNDIEWDLAVDESFFRPSIPDGYSLKLKFYPVEATEEAALAGLRSYREVVGFYPDSLDSIGPSQQRDAALGATQTDEQVVEASRIMSSIAFHQELLQQDRQPRYYGPLADAAGAYLLWHWQIDEDSYRVILSTLEAETVSADRLADLQAQRGQ